MGDRGREEVERDREGEKERQMEERKRCGREIQAWRARDTVEGG